MARIPQEVIDRLKSEVSIERLVSGSGVELKPHGSDLIGHCPFHDDHTPSLVITPSKNLWHCLGACQTGGSVIDWVMKTQGVSFRHAVELLRSDFTPLAAGSSRPVKKGTVPKLPPPVVPDVDDARLLLQVVNFYHETLLESPEALAYLEKRGLSSPEMIKQFKLGFANRTLGLRLPASNRATGAEIRGRLNKLGIIRESGHEHFNGALVIPVFDEQGQVTEMYGRKITPGLRAGTPLHLYLPGPHKGVWNIEALAASKEIILCEALIDALTFWCAGFRNVTASYGVGGFTDDHMTAFKRYGVDKVLIAYDRDEAGENGAETLAKKLIEEGMSAFRIQFPKGMDANEFALKVQPSGKSLGMLVRHAVWLGGASGIQRMEAGGSGIPEEEPKEEDQMPEQEALIDTPIQPAQVSSVPVLPLADSPAPLKGDEIVMTFGERRYRMRGLDKNLSFNQLKVNVLVSTGERFHVDTFDLYSARHRGMYLKEAATELGLEEEVIKRDLGKVLLRLEELQEAQIKKTLEPKEKGIILSEAETAAAMELLKSPDLIGRILSDFEACGVVGEETNKLVGYLAAVSRKLDEPLAVIIQSSSAAGKSALMEAILAFMPAEERVKYSAMTGQSLFYMGESDLAHKILAIVEEQGAERASYALKLLQSEGELTIASTGKDPTTGRLVTHEYRVQGPVMIFLTTTAIEIDDELLNRCLVLSVNEDREQTRAIHKRQRERQTLEGLLGRRESQATLKVHQDAQRLLRPLLVANPYARQLTFLDDRTRMRRDHLKYLTLIRTIALLHQYQRPVQTVIHNGQSVPYIEVTLSDIEIANRLAHEVLGRCLDELPPQTRRLLSLIDPMVKEACEKQKMTRSDFRFSRKEIRRHTGWSYDQIRVHIDRLVELEYLLVHRGGRGQSFEYELLYDGKGADGKPFFMGLLDVKTLESTDTTKRLGGLEGEFGVALGAHLGAIGPLLGPDQSTLSDNHDKASDDLTAKPSENAHLDQEEKIISYRHSSRPVSIPPLAASSRSV
jgi:DNA primase catalytic core